MRLLGSLVEAAIQYCCGKTSWAAELGRMSQPRQIGQVAIQPALRSLRRIWRPCSASDGFLNPFERATKLPYRLLGRTHAE